MIGSLAAGEMGAEGGGRGRPAGRARAAAPGPRTSWARKAPPRPMRRGRLHGQRHGFREARRERGGVARVERAVPSVAFARQLRPRASSGSSAMPMTWTRTPGCDLAISAAATHGSCWQLSAASCIRITLAGRRAPIALTASRRADTSGPLPTGVTRSSAAPIASAAFGRGGTSSSTSPQSDLRRWPKATRPGRLGAELGQRALEGVARGLELHALVAVELAPHRAGAVEHDDGGRRDPPRPRRPVPGPAWQRSGEAKRGGRGAWPSLSGMGPAIVHEAELL